METDVKQSATTQSPGLVSEIVDWCSNFPTEFAKTWQQLPNKGVFFPLLIAWLLLFQFLGNATFGYVDTASLLVWMKTAYRSVLGEGEDGHGLLIPPLVLILLWFKRKELLAVRMRLWWPGALLLVGALLLHVFGYLIQQPRVSIVALFTGIYALAGMTWGPAWLRASAFPFFLFIFSIPIASIGEPVTVPLRRLVTHLVALICNNFMGMDVHGEGTQLFNSARTYQYEVAAACSGLRSFIAIFVLTTVYSFLFFDKGWKRFVIILSALPLAIVGNVLRMMGIVIAAEIWGRATGSYVHDSSFFSIIPYVPALIGVMLLGRWLGERPSEPSIPAAPLKPEPA